VQDEVRFSSTARSAEWIKFEYNNMGNADHELSFGSTQTTVTGTAYSDEGVTPLASQTVRLAINGVDGGTAETNASGVYTLTGAYVSGDILTVYLEDETADAVTVINSSGTSLTGINLYQNELITRSDNSSPLTNANLATAAVSGETDISGIYAVAAGALFERLEGCDLEPAAEVALAGLIRAVSDGEIPRTETVLLNLTGGGQRRVDKEGRRRPAAPDIVFAAEEVNARDAARKLAEEGQHGRPV